MNNKTHSQNIIVKTILISFTMIFLAVFLVLPLITIFQEAFKDGFDLYFKAIIHDDALSAIKLSLTAVSISLLLNLIFGIALAWLITKYNFRGKGLLLTILDIPFTISPVISGMMFILFLGINSYLGELLGEYGIKIIFATPGIVLATMFVTFPYIARELIPQMEDLGKDEEEAARLLGAKGWRILFSITLPNIKWSLFYAIILCNARAMGEFGAVSVVSGHIRGLTNTMPLHIEILYNEYNTTAAFAISTLLTFLALITLILKAFLEWHNKKIVQLHGN